MNARCVIDTPAGYIGITETDGFITSIAECDEAPGASPPPRTVLAEAVRQIRHYFAGTCTDFTFPYRIAGGTPFSRAVWQAAADIPYGHTATYADIARAIGHPRAARAVGTALGRNPLLFVIPCHRIVASGGLGGFRLGPAVKLYLLGLEKNKYADVTYPVPVRH